MVTPIRSLLAAALLVASVPAATAQMRATTSFHGTLTCRMAVIHDSHAEAFPGLCRQVALAARQDGAFGAALAKAHTVQATIMFTALPDGRIVAALFAQGTGHALIDRGLMGALAPLRFQTGQPMARSYFMPIGLHVIDTIPAVVYRMPGS